MKRIIAAVLIVAALMALVPAAVAVTPTFSDITDVQTASDVAVLQMLGVIEGDNGKFVPGGTLTRAAFCKMSVVIQGRGAEEPQNRSRTIFPDVRSDHWARGYINISASGGIVAGNSDGTFKPDDNITYAQAITILLRMLGYDESDIGMLWPSDHIRFAANIGLTDGVTVSAHAPIPRSAAARLFTNLLRVNDSAFFTEYWEKANMIKDVIILDLNATTSDGTSGAIRTTGSGTYKSKNGVVPEVFLGQRGTLVALDGQALTFIPSGGKSVTFIASSANATWIKDSSGKQYDIPKGTLVYTPDSEDSLETSFMNIASGMQITLFYKNDRIDAVFAEIRQSDDAFIVTTDSVTPAAFATLTGGDRNYKVYKNGFEITFGGIGKYDVATYNKTSKILTVSDFRVTAYYENVWPNTEYPTKVMFLGEEFMALPSAVKSLSAFKPGEVVTFLLTADNQVAGAYKPQEVRGAPLGIAKDVTTSSATVELLNGMVFKGDPQLVNAAQTQTLEGTLVVLSSSKAGCISISAIGGTGGYSAGIDLNEMTFGNTKISPNVRIFDKVKSSAVTSVSLSELMQSRIPAEKLLYIRTNSGGQVDLVILNDVTGDMYNYGFLTLKTETETSSGLNGNTVHSEWQTVTVTNSDGSLSPLRVSSYDFKSGAVGGVALSADGKSAASVITLTRADNVRRSAFKTVGDRMYVSVGGTDIPVAENVQCYNKTTGIWFESLSDARAYSDSLTVYYDRPAAENGKVRVVVAG